MLPINSMVIDSHTEATVEAANRASSTSQCIATHAHLHLAILMGMLYWRSAGFPFTSTAARFLTQRLLLARACQTVRNIHTNTQLSPPLPLSHPPLYLLISRLSFSFSFLSLSLDLTVDLSFTVWTHAIPAYLHAIETTEDVRVSCSAAHWRQARGSPALSAPREGKWRMCMYFHGPCNVLEFLSQNTAVRAFVPVR